MEDSSQTPHVELLAPAGDWECLRAAVENGADAVYFGLTSGFNARARANNFSVDELGEVMHFLHLRGVKGYVTINTLAFSNELPSVEEHAIQVYEAGADAVLVQDLGVARLLREACPDLELHASTQMTLSSAPCIEEARHLGIKRVVLPRELSIDEIGAIHQETDISLEAFVHGALCVSYSGQCLTSESLGGRSANRGQCAQACRLPYELVCDGEDVDLDNVQYLLSPKDLAAFEQVPRMIAAGVRCFKIEGRLKTPEYVANITRHYRQALDVALEGESVSFSKQQIQEMELSFSRGFSPGWLEGCDHKQLVPGISSSKRGVRLGTVEAVSGKWITIQLQAPIKAGDGVVFEGDRFRGEEQGGRIIEVLQGGKRCDHPIGKGKVQICFHRNSIDIDEIELDQRVYKTDDPALTQRLRKTYQSPDPLRRVHVDMRVEASVGKQVRVLATADNGAWAEVKSDDPLQKANKHVADLALLRKQLSRLGGTVYELRDLQAEIEDGPMIPLSVLGAIRKLLVTRLNDSLRNSSIRPATKPGANMRAQVTQRQVDDQVSQSSQLHVLCRNLEQVQTVAELGTSRRIYADFQDIREYRQAVEIVRESDAQIFLAPPRIQKPDEMGIFRAMAKHDADGILARNLSSLGFFRDEATCQLAADYSLNATNELTVEWLRDLGAKTVTTSYDLNPEQLFDLVRAVPSSWLEVVVHQHMPMFHMEHCVFCAVLSPGTNKTNCGRPCDFHEVKLRDRVGKEHPLVADVGCRNTLFNATPQSAAKYIKPLAQLGIRHFRIELLEQDRSETLRTIELYQQLVSGKSANPDHVCKQLGADARIRC